MYDDFTVLVGCVNETPLRIGGHWDELTLIMKMAPVVEEQEPDDTIGEDDTSW